MPDAPDLRVSDADREQTAERLRAAAGEGRLDPAELDERLGSAYGARTRGELDALTRDLPAAAPTPARLPPLSPERRPLASRLVPLLIPNIICVTIWALTGAEYFWPVWVMLGTGIAAVSIVVKHATGAEDRDDHRPPSLPPPPPPPGR